MANFIHPNASCDSSDIGEDTRIWGFTRIMKGVQIGKNCNICDFVFIESGVKIGDNVTIKSGVYIWTGVSIENDVFVGPNVTFTNDKYPVSKSYPPIVEKTVLRNGCSVGAGATILPGIEVGSFARVGAGAVVTKNVDPYTLVFGNPAKLQRMLSTNDKWR
jgi:UDP-2-acetamido-3-amino-2,3-dideoxy-glucuronate N-acetyltransferase